MHNMTLALVCLSLFTEAGKAAEIEGDLLEQAQRHGRLWFWWQVKLTCIALFFHGLRTEGGKLLLYGYATYELGLKLRWWVVLPMSADIRRGFALNASFESVFTVLLMAFAFALGMLVMRLCTRRAGSVLMIAFGMMFGRMVVLQNADAAGVLLLGFAFVQTMLGALLMKWIELRHAPRDAHASH